MTTKRKLLLLSVVTTLSLGFVAAMLIQYQTMLYIGNYLHTL